MCGVVQQTESEPSERGNGAARICVLSPPCTRILSLCSFLYPVSHLSLVAPSPVCAGSAFDTHDKSQSPPTATILPSLIAAIIIIMLVYPAAVIVILTLLVPLPPSASAAREGCNVHTAICSQDYAIQKQRLDSLKSLSQSSSSSLSPSSSGSGVLYNPDLYNARAKQEESAEKCSLLLGYNSCMRTLAKSCKGNIEFHSVLAVVRKWMADSNCNGSYHRTRQGVKSGIEYKREQELRKKPHESKRLRRCLNEVHNYTYDHENYLKRMESMLYNKQLQQQMTSVNRQQQQPQDDIFAVTAQGKRKSSRSKRSAQAKEEDEGGEDCDMPADDPMAESPMSSEFAALFGKDDEPLMCSLFGDPHIRTFDNNFMTCRCLGAWPMVDHPLFAVQVTNNNAGVHLVSGVTKVTVLIREFRVCGIETDLIYEVDLQDLGNEGGNPPDLPTTFTDGTTATSNSLVKVTARSGGNVCVQMDHVNAQICVYRVPFTSYLNVIVKFKKQMSSDEREQMIDSMDEASLCSRGCPDRELIRVEEILEAIGVNPSDPGIDECDNLYGYYYIYCLFDVRMKGVQKNETFVHRLAQDMDDILVVKRNFAKTHFDSNSSPIIRTWLTCSQLLILLLTCILITNLISNRK